MAEQRRSETSPAPSARDRILGRVAEALRERQRVSHPGDFPGNAPRGRELSDSIARFSESLRRSGGAVVRFAAVEEARAWLRDFWAEFASAAVAPQVPMSLRPQLPQVAPPDAELGVSLALAAAATTGSLVLDSREGRGLQLLPPVHLVWVDARVIQADLGAALERARQRGPLPAVIALHSGPSKSADIGRIVVTGVHGPGRLIAAICEQALTETSAGLDT